MHRSEDRLDSVELLTAVRSGSVDALGTLYRQYSDMVYGLAYRTTGSRHEAEDVLQDVFVGLPRALRSYHEQGRFEGWLKRIVVRTALMRIRAQDRKREMPLEETDLGAGAAESDTRSIERIAVRRAIERLPNSLRVVFVLKEIEGYSHEEIGEMLGITSGNSATRLSRAWAFLRKETRS